MTKPKIPVEDRLAIQELVARYAFLCDTGQYAGIAELFAEDGVFDESILGFPVKQGGEMLRQAFVEIGALARFMIHLNCNHQLSAFDGNRASGTTHLHCEGELRGDRPFRILGYYADDYEKSAGEWWIKRRKLIAIAPLVGFPLA